MALNVYWLTFIVIDPRLHNICFGKKFLETVKNDGQAYFRDN
jgi:hypothetical protein